MSPHPQLAQAYATNAALAAESPPDYSARPLTHHDIAALVALQEKIKPSLAKPYHLKKWTQDDVEHHLMAGGQGIVIHDQHGNLAAATILGDPDSLEPKNLDAGYTNAFNGTNFIAIQSFCVDPDHRGQKLSHKLLAGVTALYPSATLLLRTSKDNVACSLYEHLGFEQAGTDTRIDGDTGMQYDGVYYKKAANTLNALTLVQGGMPNHGFRSHYAL